LIRLLILGSGYNTMISHLGLIRTFLSGAGKVKYRLFLIFFLFRFYPVGSNPISFNDVSNAGFFPLV
ncbi:hypothetical protein, partial [Klebsiella pneumoniae]|uniref:hypothetical protein n=1 Tax=Klebsiella pneumoniae TaxID=573 RepID=UPI000D4D4DFC